MACKELGTTGTVYHNVVVDGKTVRFDDSERNVIIYFNACVTSSLAVNLLFPANDSKSPGARNGVVRRRLRGKKTSYKTFHRLNRRVFFSLSAVVLNTFFRRALPFHFSWTVHDIYLSRAFIQHVVHVLRTARPSVAQRDTYFFFLFFFL